MAATRSNTNGVSSKSREITAHLGRFVDWKPEGIEALAAHPTRPWLAVGRSTGDVELWESSAGQALRQFLVVPGTVALHLKSLAWTAGDRLVAGGLCGKLWEVDLLRRLAVFADATSGGAVWCVRSSPDGAALAVASEDGRVRLARALPLEPGVELDPPLMGGSQHRLLTVCWQGLDAVCASGVDGVIRRWSAKANRVTQTMTVPRLGSAAPPTVWALDASDDVVVSGDSLGRVSVWDGATGTLLQSFNEHLADVLAVCVCDGVVLASGADPRVSAFARTADSKWVYSYSHRPHTHDVRALCVLQGVVVSGGVDAQLCSVPVVGFESARPRKDGASPARAVALSGDVGDGVRLLMVAHHSRVELWRVGATEHALLCSLDFKAEAVYAASLAPSSRQLATSDSRFGLALWDVAYDAEEDEDAVRVSKRAAPALPASHGAPVRLAYAPDDRLLVCALQSGSVAVVAEGAVVRVFDQSAGACAQALSISADGQWLACAVMRSLGEDDVHVFSLDGLVHHVTLPRALLAPHARHAGLVFAPRSGELVLARSDGSVVRYRVEDRVLVEGGLAKASSDVAGVCFNVADADRRVYTWGRNALCALDADREACKRLTQAVHVEFIAADEVFVLAAPWIKMAAHLPDVLDRKRFGA